jgi:hypothetical protein
MSTPVESVHLRRDAWLTAANFMDIEELTAVLLRTRIKMGKWSTSRLFPFSSLLVTWNALSVIVTRGGHRRR